MTDINSVIMSINYILNVNTQFIRKVRSGNYVICEIPETIDISNNIKTLYLYNL